MTCAASWLWFTIGLFLHRQLTKITEIERKGMLDMLWLWGIVVQTWKTLVHFHQLNHAVKQHFNIIKNQALSVAILIGKDRDYYHFQSRHRSGYLCNL